MRRGPAATHSHHLAASTKKKQDVRLEDRFRRQAVPLRWWIFVDSVRFQLINQRTSSVSTGPECRPLLVVGSNPRHQLPAQYARPHDPAMTVQIAVRRLPHNTDLPLPAYATGGAAGMDLLAAVNPP